MASKIFRIRLNENHWIWSLPQKERGAVVRSILESYRNSTSLLEEIKNSLEDLKIDMKTAHGEFKITGQKKEDISVKKRLAISKDKWLNVT